MRFPVISILAYVLMVAMPGLSVAQDPDVSGVAADSPMSTTETATLVDSLRFNRPAYNYEAGGKRDPFQSLVPETIDDEKRIKQLFEYEGSTVLGIVTSEADTYALVTDNAGKSFVLRMGDRVLGGYVTGITGNTVTLHIVKYGRPMNIIMRMESSRYTVIEEQPDAVSVRKPGINIEFMPGTAQVRGVIIDEVTVPGVDMMTVEEEWFGRRDPIYDQLVTNESRYNEDMANNVTLIEPSQEAWIRLPFIMDWVAPDDLVSFTLVIDDAPDFSSPLAIRENIGTTSFLLDADLELPVNTLLYWQVAGMDETGAEYVSVPGMMTFQITGQ